MKGSQKVSAGGGRGLAGWSTSVSEMGGTGQKEDLVEGREMGAIDYLRKRKKPTDRSNR